MNKTIREVLRELMHEHRISANELAKRIPVNQPAIHRILSGVTTDPRASTLSALASYFNVTVDQLLGHSPLSSSETVFEDKGEVIPLKNIRYASVVTWEEAKTVCLENVAVPQKHRKRPVFSDAGYRAFWIQMKGNSMFPILSDKKSFLCVDPDKEPKDISLCLVYQKETKELMVRQMLADGSLKVIKTTNPNYPFTERLDDRFILCGMITEDQKDYSDNLKLN